jgi:hypothetical protein
LLDLVLIVGDQQSVSTFVEWGRMVFWVNFSRKFMMALVAFAASALTACAAPSSYMGISLERGAVSSDVQELARLAMLGDKHAQLELGIKFEKAQGVVRDISRARRLYELAATDSGGTKWIYRPSSGGSDRAATFPVVSHPRREGLSEAKKRLEMLDD